MPYDMDLDIAFKTTMNEVDALLRQRSGKSDWDGVSWASQVFKSAFGLFPDAEGANKLSDEQKRDLLPKLEGALALLRSLP